MTDGEPPKPSPGWYEHEGEKRWWDGSQWSAASTSKPPRNRKRPPVWAWIVGIVVIVVIIASSSGGKKKTHTTASTPVAPAASGGSQPAAPPPPPAAPSCGTRATDDCTPRVGPTGHVRVDALTWRVTSVRTAKTIGDQQYGLGAKASGRFVIVKLHVDSSKNESATLTDDVVHLETNGNTYDADNDGTVAAMGSGEQPFFLDTIGPDSDRTGTVVFDVPRKVLRGDVQVRFNELGFGSTHGFIKLASTS